MFSYMHGLSDVCILGNRQMDVIALPFPLQNHRILWLQCMSGNETVNIVLHVLVVAGLPVAVFVCCRFHVEFVSCTTPEVSLGFLES